MKHPILIKKKLKLYLDTSVISHLNAADTPEKMSDSLALWKEIKTGKYEVYLSTVTMKELSGCGKAKLDYLEGMLAQIDYLMVEMDDEIRDLAERIVELGILTPKSMDDCMHIACAVISGCDYLLSWNFKHLVNIRTINGVRAITTLTNYKSIDIITPTILISA